MKGAKAFKVGDAVFYPSAGVGIVEGVEDVYIGGQCDPCYVIRIAENEMTVKVPKGSVEQSGVRRLLETRRVKELYKVLASNNAHRVTGGNWTERCKELERKINRGNPLQLGEVVRDLLRWKKQSGLSFEEAMLLETACGYLARELATIQGIPHALAVDQIHDRVGVAA